MKIIELLFYLHVLASPPLQEQAVTEQVILSHQVRSCSQVISDSPGAVLFPAPNTVLYRPGVESSGRLFIAIVAEPCQ